MTKREFYYPSADGRTQIHAITWEPEEVRAVLQISHGMVEYIDRYDTFARYLTQSGFVVTGNDHLGHGASVTSEENHGFFAQPDPNRCVISDIHALRSMTRGEYKDVPYFMLGHSMGSFLLRQYLTLYGEDLQGAVIMGTGTQPQFVLSAGRLLCRILARFHGWHYRSTLVNNMALGSYNRTFEPARTPNDWLSKNMASVDAYCADPWCTFVFTVNGYFQLFTAIEAAQKNAGRLPKDLPLLVISGENDPVGGFGRDVRTVYEGYRRDGIRDVSLKLYPDDRHEILNETDRDQVYADLLGWLKARMT